MDMSGAEERIRDFLTEFRQWKGKDETHIYTTGEYGTPVRLSLHSSDIDHVLRTLEMARRVINGQDS